MSHPSNDARAARALAVATFEAMIAEAAAAQANAAAYTPTEAQRRLVATAKRQQRDVSIRELCRRAHVARGTVYRWRRRPAFRAWITRELLSYWFLTGCVPLAMAQSPAPAPPADTASA